MFGDLSVSVYLAQENIDDRNASRAINRSQRNNVRASADATLPLQYSLGCDFGKTAIVSSGL